MPEHWTRHERVLDPSRACLLVVDIQERFRPVMEGFDEMVAGAVRLIKTFRALSLPVLATEQYPKGLGQTASELREVLGAGIAPYEKTCFSSCRSDEVAGQIRDLAIGHVVVCGIETHVCVSQSVHDLLARNLGVFVPVDAVESRRALDRDVALRKMERSGAVLTTTEAAAFELLEDARHPKFREVQALFK